MLMASRMKPSWRAFSSGSIVAYCRGLVSAWSYLGPAIFSFVLLFFCLVAMCVWAVDIPDVFFCEIKESDVLFLCRGGEEEAAAWQGKSK